MQNITSSFARDWQFLKISRNWKPHDFSKEVLERLIQENDRNLNERISSIIFDIGMKEGREIKARLGTQIEIQTVIEGIMLISGQNYSINENDGITEINIFRVKNSNEKGLDSQDIISFPYLRGVIKSIMPESQLLEKSEGLTILF